MNDDLAEIRRKVKAEDIAQKIIELEEELLTLSPLEGQDKRIKLAALKHLFRMLTIDD